MQLGEIVPPREFVLYADESIEKGPHFSNFYGGLMVSSQDRDAVVSLLEAEKARLNLCGEVKWQKVTLNYLNKYERLMSVFFNYVREGRIKLRILFTDNFRAPRNLAPLNFSDRYLLLYLAFIEHAFDIRYRTPRDDRVRLRILLDELPVSDDDKRNFRQQILRLNNGPTFRDANVRVFPDGIGEIDSKDHVLLQCLDIVLGAMQSRLNAGPSSQCNPAGKRTAAKFHLSTHILRKVTSIHADFHLAVTTPVATNQGWQCSYRHRLFGSEGIETGNLA